MVGACVPGILIWGIHMGNAGLNPACVVYRTLRPSFQLFLSELFGLKMVKQNFKATLISQPCWNATLNEAALTFDWQSIVLLQALICCSFCPPTHQMLLNLNSTITSNKGSRLIQNSEESIIYTNLDTFWTSQSKIRPARVKGWNILY